MDTISSFDNDSSISPTALGGTSTLEMTEPNDVGGVDDDIDGAAELLSTDVDTEFAKDCGTDFALVLALAGVVICDI